jgi:hypothetical protein
MPVDEQHQRVLNYNDNVVNCAFVCWADYFAPWKARLRVLGTWYPSWREFHLMNGMSD